MFNILVLLSLLVLSAALDSSSVATTVVTGGSSQTAISTDAGSTVTGSTGGSTASVTDTSVASSATTASGCSDINTDCANKVSLCQANGYVEFMKEQCAQTCGYCGGSTQTNCVDSDTRCTAWSANGYCTNAFYTPEIRKQYCAKTCNLC